MERKTLIKIIVIIAVCVVILGVAIGLLVWGLRGDKNGEDQPVVTTSLGTIRGVKADDGDFSKYLGVPYGLVDESNPFGLALPHPRFEDIFEANDDSTFCVQRGFSGRTEGVLQCLQLNIYVPNSAKPQNLRPVMVWIHGGGFSGGTAAGEYPKSLVQNDVIVVSVAYRLGVYGFMCLDIPEVPGNQGFKDQVLAFRWIKENIEAFGGDPNSITAFGQSAGAMAVNAHLYSDYERLFDKAIMQSGSALSNWFFVPSYSYAPFRLAEYFGYQTTDINDALAYLATVDPLAVTDAAYETELISAVSSDTSKIKPCVEKKLDGVEHFITEHPLNARIAPKVNSSFLMIGYTDEEFGLEFLPPAADGNYDYFDHNIFLGFHRDEALNRSVELAKRFYLGDEREIGINVRQESVNFAGDIVFAYPAQRMAIKFLENGANAVYRYVFSYIGNKSVTGASHGAELPFLFDRTLFAPVLDKNEEEQRLTNQMIKLWTNFAKYGNPTPEVTDLLPMEWKPITKRQQFSLDLNSELSLKSRPERRRVTFWELFYRVYKKFEIGYIERSD